MVEATHARTLPNPTPTLPKYGVLLTPKYGQKRVPYAEMRFFFCTHAQLYDLPTRWPSRPSGVGRLVGNEDSILSELSHHHQSSLHHRTHKANFFIKFMFLATCATFPLSIIVLMSQKPTLVMNLSPRKERGFGSWSILPPSEEWSSFWQPIVLLCKFPVSVSVVGH